MEFWKFEDVIAWQKSRRLVSSIYAATELNAFSRDFRFRDQIRSAAISIMSNIAEGAESGSTKEFIRYLNIARASCGEVRSDLYVALDLSYIERELFCTLFDQLTEVTKLVSGLRKSLVEKLSK
jgi:four helix bundle protein